MNEKSNKELIRLANEIYGLFQEQTSKLPYGANVIDELHANENAHSRILRLLLAYKGSNNYPVYASFLRLMVKHCLACRSLEVVDPVFKNEEGRIDVLIKESLSKNPFAVIIENKVRDAVDQDEQIQRYLNKVMTEFPSDRIFVVYLTKDGEKQVADYSLTEQAKTILGMTNESDGRYIPLNYRYEILPWLEQEVLPNLPLKEDLLAASVKLYIDYLKGMFNMRADEKPILASIYAKMRNELNINSIEDSISVFKQIDFLNSSISNMLNEDIEEVLENHLYQPLFNLFPGSSIYNKEHDFYHFAFSIFIPTWNNCHFCLKWDKKGQYIGIGYLDQENPLDDETCRLLKARIGEEPSNEWWAWYKYVNQLIPNSCTLDVWKEVENGTVLRFFTDWISSVIEKTRDLNI